jgi:hypothetical protein
LFELKKKKEYASVCVGGWVVRLEERERESVGGVEWEWRCA